MVREALLAYAAEHPGQAGDAARRIVAGDIIGAVGISGDSPDKDEICAVAGIAGAGL